MEGAPSNKALGRAQALARAVAALPPDLATRAPALGLPPPDADGWLRFSCFGQDLALDLTTGGGRCSTAMGYVKIPATAPLVVLHLLVSTPALRPTGEFVPYRAFPGGAFYQEPYRRRTEYPLAAGLSDLATVQARLSELVWQPFVGGGTLNADLVAFGHVHLGLCWHAPDETGPTTVDILFDRSILPCFGAEDAAALALLLRRRLTTTRCAPCTRCGLCDT